MPQDLTARRRDPKADLSKRHGGSWNERESMLVITVEFVILPEWRSAFLDLMLANAQQSLAREPGCRCFNVCTDPARPTDIFLYEIYGTWPSFQAHLASEHYRRFESQVQGWVTSKAVRSLSLEDMTRPAAHNCGPSERRIAP